MTHRIPTGPGSIGCQLDRNFVSIHRIQVSRIQSHGTSETSQYAGPYTAPLQHASTISLSTNKPSRLFSSSHRARRSNRAYIVGTELLIQEIKIQAYMASKSVYLLLCVSVASLLLVTKEVAAATGSLGSIQAPATAHIGGMMVPIS